jgi:hypothetical protein
VLKTGRLVQSGDQKLLLGLRQDVEFFGARQEGTIPNIVWLDAGFGIEGI